MKVHVRVDDFPYGTPQDKVKYNRDEAAHKVNLLNQLGPCMIACVLEEMNEDTWSMLSGNLIPCFHGFTHGLDVWRPLSECGGEFYGQEYSQIKENFLKHKEVIDKYNIKIVIPPFNSYTQALLDVIDELKFKYLIGGTETTLFSFDKLNHKSVKLLIPDLYPPLGLCLPEGQWVNYLMQNKHLVKEGSTLCIHFPFDDVPLLCELVKTVGAEVVPYD